MRPSSCLLAFLVTAGFLAVGARPAAACSCAGGLSPCEAFARSPIVFVGEVMSVEKAGDDFHMRLRVVRALKGIAAATADLWSDATSSCGVKLDQGKRYVIYTHLVGGRMSLHACGYGRELTSGEPDPELPPVPGRVYGRVVRYDVDRIREFKSLAPIPAVRVALDRPGGRVIATSDKWGRFQFTDVPPGNYQLAVDAGQGLTPWMPDTVVVPDGEACVDTRHRPLACRQGVGPCADRRREAGRRDLCAAAARRAGWQPPRATRRPRAGDGCRRPVHIRGTTRGQLRPRRQPGGQRGDRAATVRAGLVRRHRSRVSDAIRVAEGSAIELDRPFVLPASLSTRTFTVAVTWP